MAEPFDYNKAKENLKKQERLREEELERTRIQQLNKVIAVLKEYFFGKNVEVFLVGSIVVPEKFREYSDVDIVLKNFQGDRFEVWAELDRKIERDIELILYEKCSFQDFIDEFGLRVI